MTFLLWVGFLEGKADQSCHSHQELTASRAEENSGQDQGLLGGVPSPASGEGLANAPKLHPEGHVQKCLGRVQWQGVSQAWPGSSLWGGAEPKDMGSGQLL